MSRSTFHKELYNCTGPYYMQVHRLAVYTNGFVQALYMHTYMYVYIIILSSTISPWMHGCECREMTQHLNVSGEGRDLGVKEGVQGSVWVHKVLRELSHDPGSCIEHLTYSFLPTAARKQVSVLQNGGLCKQQGHRYCNQVYIYVVCISYNSRRATIRKNTICLTAKGRTSLTRMATSNICEAMGLPTGKQIDTVYRYNTYINMYTLLTYIISIDSVKHAHVRVLSNTHVTFNKSDP